MIVTEEEAKTKRCQEGYAASPGATLNPSTDYVQQSFVVPSVSSHALGGASFAAATTAAPMTAPIFCLGSACMAWKWSQIWRDNELVQDRTIDGIALGSCGKAP
jgi:hypothetical protein